MRRMNHYFDWMPGIGIILALLDEEDAPKMRAILWYNSIVAVIVIPLIIYLYVTIH
jgi:hypothetical protein